MYHTGPILCHLLLASLEWSAPVGIVGLHFSFPPQQSVLLFMPFISWLVSHALQVSLSSWIWGAKLQTTVV